MNTILNTNSNFIIAILIVSILWGCSGESPHNLHDDSPTGETAFRELEAISLQEDVNSDMYLFEYQRLFDQLDFEEQQDLVVSLLEVNSSQNRFQFRFPVGADYYYPSFDAALKNEGFKKVKDMIFEEDHDFNKLKNIWANHREGFDATDTILIHEVEFEYGEDVPVINKRIFFNGFELSTSDFFGEKKEKYKGSAKFLPTSISIVTMQKSAHDGKKYLLK